MWYMSDSMLSPVILVFLTLMQLEHIRTVLTAIFRVDPG